MTYPNSSAVSAGDPTEASQYNDLRKDAIYLGADPTGSGTLRDLLYQLTGKIRLSRNGTAVIRLSAEISDPCGIMPSVRITGASIWKRAHPPLPAAGGSEVLSGRERGFFPVP